MIRYRLPAGSVPPLTDVIGHLVAVEPEVRVRTKTGAVVEISPDDVVAVKALTDAPVRTSQIRAVEHAAAMAWPGIEQEWLDGWLLRAAGGYTHRANSAVPLGVEANIDAVPAIVDWYTPAWPDAVAGGAGPAVAANRRCARASRNRGDGPRSAHG